jgi:hypothetical protein
VRLYPFNAAAHILGYINEVDTASLTSQMDFMNPVTMRSNRFGTVL